MAISIEHATLTGAGAPESFGMEDCRGERIHERYLVDPHSRFASGRDRGIDLGGRLGDLWRDGIPIGAAGPDGPIFLPGGLAERCLGAVKR